MVLGPWRSWITSRNRGHNVQTVIDELNLYIRGWLNDYKLSSTYKEVLVLQAYFGYATDEMAHILGVSETAVSNRILRARKALSEQRHSPHTASPHGSERDRPKGLAVVLPLRRTTP